MTYRIVYEIPDICRVCYDLAPKPAGMAKREWGARTQDRKSLILRYCHLPFKDKS